ncbi:MAG: hypothetical protein ACYS7Y_29645, partial [Planctomycetota bacterium]
MRKKKNYPRTRFAAILPAVMLVMLTVVPCIALPAGPLIGNQTVDSGDTLNLGTFYDPNIGVDDGWLKVYGTLNMYSGAYVDRDIFAYPGGEVNVYGCAADNTLWVLVPADGSNGDPPVVTVYGPKFRIGTVTHDPADDIDIPINGPLEVLSEDETEVLFSLTIYSGDIDIRLRAPGSVDPIEVDIDIKPGSDPNPINPGSNGLIPVAILTTDDFDAATVDPATVTLAGAQVAVRGKADKRMARMEDVDDDGDLDLMLQVETQSDGEEWTTGTVTLTGQTD